MEAVRASGCGRTALALRCLALAFALVTALLGLGACGAGGGEPQANSQPSSSASEDWDGQRRPDLWDDPDNFLEVELLVERYGADTMERYRDE